MDQAPIVRLRLLGPALAADGLREALLVDERPAHVLLLLALAPGWLSRSAVAEQIWIGMPRDTALRNLRKTLHKLRAQWWGVAADIEPERLRLRAETDLAAFSSLLDAGDTIEALTLVQGPLALGLAADGGDASTAWLGRARAHWLGRWRTALLAALPRLPATRAENELVRLRRWDPHDEDLARAHLALLASGGRRSEFEGVRLEFASRLADDLGVDLPASLRDGPVSEPPVEGPGFIGRDDELTQLTEWLAAPASLVAVVGLAGIGKTRLAAEASLRVAQQGIVVSWLRLSDLTHTTAVWPRLAALLGADLRPGRDALPVLAAALARQPSLLVADNAEHLLAGGLAQALEALHHAVPTLRLLVTSRVIPPIGGARLLMLKGLEVPDPVDPPGAVLRSDAARLFVARARRLDAAFDARAAAPAIGRIARAAEGHPLAIEQAASWVRSAQPEEIADELDAGQLPDASGGFDIEAVFMRTWDLLAPPQRRALATLAALPASFDRAAALAIAGLRPAEFGALVEKSLIDASGTRWRLHPLWRSWLRRHGSTTPDAGAAVARRAALHYAAEHEALRVRHGRDGPQTLAWMDAELPHLLAAWDDALARADAALLESLVAAFEVYLELRGRRDEALAMLSHATAVLSGGRAPRRLRGRLELSRAALCYRAGRFDDAEQLAASAHRRAAAVGDWRAVAGALRVLGIVPLHRAETERPLALLREVHEIALREGYDDLLPDATMNIAIVEHRAASFADAEMHYRQVVDLARQFGRKRLLVNVLVNLGALLRDLGRWPEVRPMLEEALAVADEQGLMSMRSHVLVGLGAALLEQDDRPALERVTALALRSVAEGGEGSEACEIELLAAMTSERCGRRAEAWRHLGAAHDAAVRLGWTSALNAMPVYVARLLVAGGQRAAAAAWLAYGLRQQPLLPSDRADAEALLRTLAVDADARAAAESASIGLGPGDLRACIMAGAAT